MKQKHNISSIKIMRISYILYNLIYRSIDNINIYMCCEWYLRTMTDENVYIFVTFLEIIFRWFSDLIQI